MKEIRIVVTSLAVAAFLAVAVSFLTDKYFRDYSYWIEYKSIQPVSPTITNNHELWMISNADINREADVEWQDILMCRLRGTEDPYGRVSRLVTATYKVKPQHNKTTLWLYSKALPMRDSECYIDSTIFVRPTPYILHIQRMDSSTFRIKPP